MIMEIINLRLDLRENDASLRVCAFLSSQIIRLIAGKCVNKKFHFGQKAASSANSIDSMAKSGGIRTVCCWLMTHRCVVLPCHVAYLLTICVL